MASRTVTVSDITAEDIEPGELVRIIVHEHSSIEHTVKLDAAYNEVAELRDAALDVVVIEMLDNEGHGDRLVVDSRAFNSLFKRDVNEVLETAEVLNVNRQRRATNGTAVKVDYTAPENYGVIHRGIVTDEEKQLVRDNLEQANQNRARNGQPAIDPKNPKEAARYGLKAK